MPRKQSTASSCLPQKRSLQVLQVSRKLHLVVPNVDEFAKVQSCLYWQLQGGSYQALASDIVTCSMWVACAGSRCTSNTTTNDGEDSISHQVDALVFPPTTSLAWHHSAAGRQVQEILVVTSMAQKGALK